MKQKKVLFKAGILLLSLLLLPGLSGRGAISNLLATPTPTPTLTPTATPTATPTPIPSVYGRLINMENDKPLVGALVILCRVTEKDSCTVDKQLVATTRQDGRFEIPVVSEEYAILYNTSGKMEKIPSDLKLKYGEPGQMDKLAGMTALKVLLRSLSGGRDISKGDIDGCLESIITPEGMMFESSYLYYRPYDLGLVMYKNKLVSVKVDGPTEINLAVWDLQGSDQRCDDFNPYR